MALYKVDQGNKKLDLQTPSSFVTEKVLERKDLQPLIRDNLAVIDGGLFLLSEEFNDLAGAARRVDLLALDSSGNLVVIELKRVDDGSHMELQSLRYAAMLSALTLEDVVRIYESYLSKCNQDGSQARPKIEAFLSPTSGGQPEISNTPRIVLISPGFSQEVAQTVLWLNAQGLDIRCVELKLYVISNEKYIEVEQIIPLPTAAQYQFALQDKASKQKQAAVHAKKLSIEILVSAGILQNGTTVCLIKAPKTGADIGSLDDTYKRAVFVEAGRRFRWEHDQNLYSATALTMNVNKLLGGSDTDSLQGPLYWAIEGQKESLAERAKQIAGNGVVDAQDDLLSSTPTNASITT